MAELMVLCVLSMNNVGFRSSSPFEAMSSKNCMLISYIPLEVAATMASGHFTPASSSARNTARCAAFINFPILLASIGAMNAFKPANCSTESTTTSAITLYG